MSWFWYKGGHAAHRNADWNAPVPEPGEWRLEALYAWERRLRGYDLYPEPVALEPAFVAFEPNADAAEGGWESVPQPQDGREDEALSYLTLRLPPQQKVTPAQASELLAGLQGLSGPVSLEIVANHRCIHYQIACAGDDVGACTAAFGQCFPQAKLGSTHGPPGPDALLHWLLSLEERHSAYRIVDFGLHEPAYLPLKMFDSFAFDPHSPIIAALGSLKDGEIAGMQILAVPTRGSWRDSLTLLVAQFEGVTERAHPNTRDNELERSLRCKLGSPLWAVAVRAFAFASTDDTDSDGEGLADRSLDLCRGIGAALDAAGTDGGNRLVALDDTGYPHRDRLTDLLDRRSRRAGMVISQAEVVGLWHPPSERLQHRRLVRYDPSLRELPDYLRDAEGAMLGVLKLPPGVATDGDEPQLVPWPDAMRPRHLYMLGATRMGKSTLLLNLICQDMLAGRGLCLIDPHGDLTLDVLERVPPERLDDVLYLDLSDTAYPPALGLMEAADEWEKGLLVSDVLAVMHRLFRASWGDRLEHILRHSLLTLLAAGTSPFGTPLTLRDIRPLLASKDYRKLLLESLPDLDLRTFWETEFAGYSSSAFAPVYNKLSLLLSSPVVRNIIGGGENRLHAGEVIQRKQVVLVNLAQSLIGEDNAHFLGALLVSKIQLAAMHNLRLGRGERTPFTLYVDEFQNFVVSSFEKILSEAGKAGLTLVMANQFLEQLSDGLATAIRSNAGTLISFRVSAQSGRALEGEFGGLFGAPVLTDLERGQAVARIGRAGDSFLVRTFPPVEPATMRASQGTAAFVRDVTRSRVCRPREEVEAELRAGDEALHRMLQQAAEAEAKARKEKAAGSGRGKSEPNQAVAPVAAEPETGEPPAGARVAATDTPQLSDESVPVIGKGPSAVGDSTPSLFFGLPDELAEGEEDAVAMESGHAPA